MTAPSLDCPGRLWSLWEIMNVFRVDLLCFLLDQLHGHESHLVLLKMDGKGASAVPEPYRTQTLELVEKAQVLFKQDGLEACADAAGNAKFYLVHQGADVSTSYVALNRFKSDVMKELGLRQFLRVADDRPSCVDSEMAFGQTVFDAFPSARDDIKAAYNCLAAECSTAAVFHLMRAAEIGLRALAFDRAVKVFKNKRTMLELPLELASWDQIIKELEEAEAAIQNYPQTLAREQQFDFYHGANIQFRAFKNHFRNNIMHSRESYDRDEANSASHKVGEFMQILASKIREGDQTLTIWI